MKNRHIELRDAEITNLIIFLGLAEGKVKEIKLLPEDEYLRTAMLRSIENLLKKFEN